MPDERAAPPIAFAKSAGDLAGLAARALGWTPDVFWQATPAELAAVLAPTAGCESEALSREEMAQLMKDHDNG